MATFPLDAFVFQASGPDFRPSSLAITFAAAHDPGEIATFGAFAGQCAPRGSALYIAPAVIAGSGSPLERLAEHLAIIQPALRSAGATDFVLHVTSHGTASGNVEFSRRELAALAVLDCHIFYRSGSMESESDGT
ncbi:MAG: hypothetical protein FIB06_01470 [Betaproteobacteria bacterium]|nr:hypothetical protein [Betaproteobacteria bacterium]